MKKVLDFSPDESIWTHLTTGRQVRRIKFCRPDQATQEMQAMDEIIENARWTPERLLDLFREIEKRAGETRIGNGRMPPVDALEIASETVEAVIKALARCKRVIDEAYVNRTYKNRVNAYLRKKYTGKKTGTKRVFVEFDDAMPVPDQTQERTVEQEAVARESARETVLHWMGTLHHVMEYGEHPKRGVTHVVVGEHLGNDLSAAANLSILLTRTIRTAPVDAKTRTRAYKKFMELMRNASGQVKVVDVGAWPEEEVPGLTFIPDDDEEWCDYSQDAMRLIGILYDRLEDLVIMDHVAWQVEEVLEDDEEVPESLFRYHTRDAEDIEEDIWEPGGLMAQLHRLWRDAEGVAGCMTLGPGEKLGPGFRIFGCEGNLVLVPPVSDDPQSPVALTAGREQSLRRLGYQPRDSGSPVWTLPRRARNKDDLKRVMNKVARTLREVHGIDIDAEDVEFFCDYGMEDQDMIKTPETMPIEGMVNLNRYCKMINTERVLGTLFHEDKLVEEPVGPDDSRPVRPTKVNAVHLGWLLSLCAEGALEDPDVEEWDDEDIDDEKLQYYLDRLGEYLDNKVFVSLLMRDPEAASYMFHWAVIEQPYIIGADGEVMFTLDDDDDA